jgi:hypothetical protein
MNPVLVPCYYSNVSVWGGGGKVLWWGYVADPDSEGSENFGRYETGIKFCILIRVRIRIRIVTLIIYRSLFLILD